MRRDLVNGVSIIAFLLTLLAPAIQEAFHPFAVPDVRESRARLPIPDGAPIASLWAGGSYFADYEKHYNDVFGFRGAFIRVRNQIQYSLFRDSDQVVFGSGGWIMDKSSIETQQRRVDGLSDASWKRLGDRLAHLGRILRRRGITLVVLPVPLKNTVYPELFPTYAAVRPAVTGIARFGQLLRERGINSIDALGTLTAAKSRGDVYYRTDLHWNIVGAAVVARATIDQLGRTFGIKPSWMEPSRYTTQPLVGDEADNLAVLWPPPDTMYMPATVSCGVYEPGTAKKLPYATFVNTCGNEVLLPPVTVFGNSFSLMLDLANWQAAFSKMYRAYDLEEFPHILTSIGPGSKIVIWQLFELELGYQAQDDHWWAGVDADPTP